MRSARSTRSPWSTSTFPEAVTVPASASTETESATRLTGWPVPATAPPEAGAVCAWGTGDGMIAAKSAASATARGRLRVRLMPLCPSFVLVRATLPFLQVEQQAQREQDRGDRRRPDGDGERNGAARTERGGEVADEVEREAGEDREQDHDARLAEAVR